METQRIEYHLYGSSFNDKRPGSSRFENIRDKPAVLGALQKMNRDGSFPYISGLPWEVERVTGVCYTNTNKNASVGFESRSFSPEEFINGGRKYLFVETITPEFRE